MRKLSDTFIDDLKNENGLLHAMLERVKQDHTLMLAIRTNYINIYYRGGNILRIKEMKNSTYNFHFDMNYNQTGKQIPDLPATVKNEDDVVKWVDNFPLLKEFMDFWFSVHPKSEREFQQLIVRENNCAAIAKSSEYYISDIEFADPKLGARFEMLAIRRFPHKLFKTNNQAALIEVKYGDNALSGTAGMIKHLEDMDALISEKDRFLEVLKTMEKIHNQLDYLGLLNNSNEAQIKLDYNKKPEVIFVLANHNPRSSKLGAILNDPEFVKYGHSDNFDLKFFDASFAGYGFYGRCMLDLETFQKLLEK